MANIMLLATWILTLFSIGVHGQDGPELCNNPADIVFVLDESGSIWGPHFIKQLEFVCSIIDTFNVELDETRIGVETFNDSNRNIFNLGDYVGAHALNEEVMKITQSRGGTRTDLALARMRVDMFSAAHARASVPHIAIVITDGDSEEPGLTAEEAARARQSGVVIIAVGVGTSIGYAELNAIATSPDLVFEVDNYDTIAAELQEILASKVCEVITMPPPTTTTTTTPEPTTPPQMIEGCTGSVPMDVVFALPDQADAVDTEYALAFVASLIQNFVMGPDQTHVGLTPRYCEDAEGIHLREYDSRASFQLALERRLLTSTRTDWQLMYMAEEAFLPENGGRRDSAKFGLLVVDNHSLDLEETLGWASVVKDEGIHLVVVGVGASESLKSELRQVASSPADFHEVPDYEQLAVLQANIIRDLCEEISNFGFGNRQYRGFAKMAKKFLKARRGN